MKRKKHLLTAAVLLLFAALCRFPDQGAQAVRSSLSACAVSLIPSLFPFFVLTGFLCSLCRELRLPAFLQRVLGKYFGLEGGCLLPLLLSFFGGYPVGVSCVCELYKNGTLSKDAAQKAMLLCNNSGPAFFLGVLGAGVLGDLKAGLLLYLIHILSALLVGRLLAASPCQNHRLCRLREKGDSAGGQFLKAVENSCAALLRICGLVVFFSVLSAMVQAVGLEALLQKLPFFSEQEETKALFYGSLELTGGILRLQGMPNAIPLAAFLMGWGGLCVHFQAMSLWQEAGLQPRGYFTAKLLHGLYSALFALCFTRFSGTLWVIFGSLTVFSLLFPKIRRKWGRKILTNAV